MPRAGGTIATFWSEKKMFGNEIQRNNNLFLYGFDIIIECELPVSNAAN